MSRIHSGLPPVSGGGDIPGGKKQVKDGSSPAKTAAARTTDAENAALDNVQGRLSSRQLIKESGVTRTWTPKNSFQGTTKQGTHVAKFATKEMQKAMTRRIGAYLPRTVGATTHGGHKGVGALSAKVMASKAKVASVLSGKTEVHTTDGQALTRGQVIAETARQSVTQTVEMTQTVTTQAAVESEAVRTDKVYGRQEKHFIANADWTSD